MSAPQFRIGYLPFYVDYYEGICPDFPHEKAAVAKRCADTLRAHGELVWDGELLRDVEGAARAGRHLAEQEVDCVVVVTTIAVFGGISWAALQHLAAPILIWNAQQIESVVADYSMVEIVRNTGQIGTQALANTLVREARAFKVITGYEANADCMRQLQRFFRTARAAASLRKARLLQVGSTFPMMTDVELDEEHLAQHLGASIVRIGEPELTSAYEAIEEDAVTDHLSRLPQAQAVQDISPDEMARSVRLSEALCTLVEKTGAAAGTLNCHGANCLRNPQIGVTACYSLGVQNSQGRPFTCTGDLPTALAMLLLKQLSGVAMYTEVQVMDEARNALVIANSGEGEEAIRRAQSPACVRGNTNFKGVHGRGASFAYPLQAGPATVVSLTPTPNGKQPFRLIAAEGDILEETLPDTGSLAGFFRFAHTNLTDGYTRWLEAGAVHHAGTAIGHWSGELAEVAKLLNFEFIGI